MIPLDSTVMLTAVGVVGALLVGYCIYFDKKRLSDPDYKRKVQERRLRQLQLQRQRECQIEQQNNAIPVKEVPKELPNPETIEHYFQQELQEGEALIDKGQFELGVEHFTNALHLCNHPHKLLEVLEESLSPQVFHMLHDKIEEVAYNQYKEICAALQADEFK